MKAWLSLGLLLGGLMVRPSVGGAENWPQWRGPSFNGSTSETNLPDQLSKTENLLWSAELPGHGAGTPIVWEDRVFVSAQEKGTQKLVALCYKRQTGQLLWRRDMGIGHGNPPGRQNDMASPSAVTDGKTVWYCFGTGDLGAFDFDGKAMWSRNLQKDHGSFNILYLYGSSPLLCNGKLYVQVIHRDIPWVGRGSGTPADSYLLAIDPATGKDLWKQARPTDAQNESQESYGTPMPRRAGYRSEVLVVGGDYVTAHDGETGKELWRCGEWNPTRINHWRMVPSVLAAEDLVIVCTPKATGHVLAMKAGGSPDVTSSHVAWRQKQTTSDVCTPLYYQGNLYVLDGDFRKGLYCLELSTGRIKWSGRIESGPVLRASPTGADGKIYIMNEAGDVWVLSAGEFKVLSKTSLSSEGTARASIVAAQGQVLVRTGERLWAFGRKLD